MQPHHPLAAGGRRPPFRVHGVYLIVDLDSTQDPIGLAEAAIRGGVKLLQLRAKGRDKGDLLPIARTLADRCRSAGIPFLVNDHVDLAVAVDADGVHLGQNDLPLTVARGMLGRQAIIGVSTNSVDEAQSAASAGASYIGVGAMFPTTSKQDTRPAGLARLIEIRQAVDLPIVAIGGIDAQNAPSVLEAGADSIAIIGAISKAPEPERMTRQLSGIFGAEPGQFGEPPSAQIEAIVDAVRGRIGEKYRARERGLQVGRDVIRQSANAIRAVHRGEFEAALDLLNSAGRALADVQEEMRLFPDSRYSGILQDPEKEFSEAALTLAIVAGTPVPSPDDLGVGEAPYLNGLGETVGELRRVVLDILRQGGIGDSERLLQVMDDIYGLLVTVDFPDSMTGGLRRTTDSVRGILERTRGDLTTAVRQQRLEAMLAAFEDKIG